MAETCKDEAMIEIVKQQKPTSYLEMGDEVIITEDKIPFFTSVSKTKHNTWVISLFVVIHLATFAATMIVNDCWGNSHADCALKPLGRLSFQRLAENPLLGPSSSTLDKMGALQRTSLTQHRQTWRLFTCLWLHAGVVHLIVNLSSIIFTGIHLEQEFGPLRIGIIYLLSAFISSLVAAIFVQNNPALGSSGPLFGLIGAMLSSLVRNWKIYTNKIAAFLALFFIVVINFLLGLSPYVDNFSNIGGFISGFLLGFVLLFDPRLMQVPKNKVGIFENSMKSSVSFKQKLDMPMLRSVSLLMFGLIFTVSLIAVLHNVDANKYCSWCRYINCVPSKVWSCNEKAVSCEMKVSLGRLTLTCPGSDNFRVFPYTNLPRERISDLCSLICS